MAGPMTLELPPELVEEVERVLAAGQRLVLTRDGVPYAAIISLEDLRRLQALEAERAPEDRAVEQNGLDRFISMAGQVRSGEHDVSAEKYRHLAEAYATKP
jgi:PHD/YefM family antitoxin component YafN of YafNO toxin-antitoxin module